MKVRKREPVVVEYCCVTCDQPWVDQQKIIEHLQKVHQINLKRVIGAKREGLLFLDGVGFYDNTYKFTLDKGVIIHKHTRGPKGSL